jgi:hypothetical protein
MGKEFIGLSMRLMVLVFGLAILFVSIARAGLEILAKESTDSISRNNAINFVVKFQDGETAPGNYNFPETGMLPDNIFYGLKKIRDYLWLSFSQGLTKAKISLLLADKSMSESKDLLVKDNTAKAIEAGNEAMDKLEYADKLINEFKVPDGQTKQVHYQIFWAGFAYKEVLSKAGESFEIDTDKYSKLINRIDDWNKEQEKNRYSWDF